MKQNRDAFYAKVIAEYIGRVQEYTAPYASTLEALEDQKTYDAVYLRLQQLSDMTKRMSNAYKAAHPDVPWQDIAGFRNYLVHGYLGEVELPIIIETIDTHLPFLLQQLTQPTE